MRPPFVICPAFFVGEYLRVVYLLFICSAIYYVTGRERDRRPSF